MAVTDGGRCVVVGGGFGGLQAVKALGRANVDVTLVDRHNYHLFQPLSYQVATGSLSPGEIAVPLRRVFRRDRRVRVLMGEVTGFDLARQQVEIIPAVVDTSPRTIPYDTRGAVAGTSRGNCPGGSHSGGRATGQRRGQVERRLDREPRDEDGGVGGRGDGLPTRPDARRGERGRGRPRRASDRRAGPDAPG